MKRGMREEGMGGGSCGWSARGKGGRRGARGLSWMGGVRAPCCLDKLGEAANVGYTV